MQFLFLSGKCAVLLCVLLFVCILPSPINSLPQPQQRLDTYTIRKSANSTYTYKSTHGQSRSFGYAFGDAVQSGYKTKSVVNYISSPVIIHAENNRTFVKFGLKRPDDELVYLESKHSTFNDQNKQVIEFETSAPDHKFSYLELFSNDPNFKLKTEFKDNYLSVKFYYTKDVSSQKLATINVYGYHNDRLPTGCYLYYYNCNNMSQ